MIYLVYFHSVDSVLCQVPMALLWNNSKMLGGRKPKLSVTSYPMLPSPQHVSPSTFQTNQNLLGEKPRITAWAKYQHGKVCGWKLQLGWNEGYNNIHRILWSRPPKFLSLVSRRRMQSNVRYVEIHYVCDIGRRANWLNLCPLNDMCYFTLV